MSSWNEFQRLHRGLGLSKSELSALYRMQKQTGAGRGASGLPAPERSGLKRDDVGLRKTLLKAKGNSALAASREAARLRSVALLNKIKERFPDKFTQSGTAKSSPTIQQQQQQQEDDLYA